MEPEIFSLELDEQHGTQHAATNAAEANEAFLFEDDDLFQNVDFDRFEVTLDSWLDFSDHQGTLLPNYDFFLSHLDFTTPLEPETATDFLQNTQHNTSSYSADDSWNQFMPHDPSLLPDVVPVLDLGGYRSIGGVEDIVEPDYKALATENPDLINAPVRSDGKASSPTPEPLLGQIGPSRAVSQLADNPDLAFPLTGQKAKRTHISADVKARLEASFALNPYPSTETISLLSASAHISDQAVRTWFMNARQRKEKRISNSPNTSLQMDLGAASGSLETTSPLSTISIANLDTLNHMPQNAHETPLENYLSASIYESPASPFFYAPQSPEYFLWTQPPVASTAPIAIPSKERSQSLSSSLGSCGSAHSSGSFRSVDSRGSRRGRRGWTEMDIPYDRTDSNDLCLPEPRPRPQRIFCTWPSCTKEFQFRSEWSRHEEAKHYCPYHWICCSSQDTTLKLAECIICDDKNVSTQHIIERHFSACLDKSETDRTFYRQDQFIQHVQGVHKRKHNITLPKALITAFKTINQSLNPLFLACGFCGISFSCWMARSDHVFQHLKDGVCKSAWWPQRLPKPTCSTASLSIPWSCRYLYDHHGIFESDSMSFLNLGRRYEYHCILCKEMCHGTKEKPPFAWMQVHINKHKLRACSQDVFHGSSEGFWAHMQEFHGAKIPWEKVMTSESFWRLEYWGYVQGIHPPMQITNTHR